MPDPRLQALYDQLDTILLVLDRPVVQRQLVGFLIVFVLAWLLPLPFNRLVSRLPARRILGIAGDPAPNKWRKWLIRWSRALRYVIFPILGILLSQVAVALFERQDWRAGLLEQLIPVFWLVLIFRVAGGVLTASAAPATARRYNRRFVVPIFIILFGLLIGARLGGTFPIGSIQLATLMENPITVRTLVWSAIVFYLFLSVAWIVREAIDGYLLRRANVEAGGASSVRIITHYAIISMGILTALSTLGFDLSSLAIIGGGLSVGIGFGLQELVANFVSGILLLFEQTLRTGDVVEINGQQGVVSRLTMRATVLRTIDNIEIFVPNKTLLTSTVSTYTHTERVVRRSLAVGVDYNSNPTQVRDILLKIGKNHGLVLDQPEPTVFFTGFGDSSLNFELAIWLDEPMRAAVVLSDLHFMIFAEFQKQGITIPFPQHDLHLRSSELELPAPKQVNGRQNREEDGDERTRQQEQPLHRTAVSRTEETRPRLP